MTSTLGPDPVATYGGIVALERTGDTFSGVCHGGRDESRGYGGSVLAHGLAAAHATVPDDRAVHSLHAYFLRAVDSTVQMDFGVTTIRDGRSYSVRRVDAQQPDTQQPDAGPPAGQQHGRPTFTMTTSFKRPQPGAHERSAVLDLGAVSGPDGLPDGFGDRSPHSPVRELLECREAPAVGGVPPSGELVRDVWFRLRHPLGDEDAAHVCGLAYLSDVTLTPTAFLRLPGGVRSERSLIASLDHAMWFHRPARADRWLLYRQRSRIEADGRTFARGELWQDGELVASVAQEALLHIPDDSADA